MADVADRTWSAVERARGEAELRKSEERLRLAAHAARFGTYDVDLVANASYWSAELRTIIGLPMDAPASPPSQVPDFIHPEDRGHVKADVLASLRYGTGRNGAGRTPNHSSGRQRAMGPD